MVDPSSEVPVANKPDLIPVSSYEKVVEANRRFYSRFAKLYDATETCVTDAHAQSMLEADLDRVIKELDRHPTKINALDACGGSGNISLKLIRRGVNVTLADVSPELVEIFREKASRLSATPKTCVSEIKAFLDSNRETYDLIVFSSALHHLENIEDVLASAVRALKPGGFIFTVFDPVAVSTQKKLTRVILRLDYILFKVFGQPGELLASVSRRVRRKISGANKNDKQSIALNEDTAGVLAEYHVDTGIDDYALVSSIRKQGSQVVWHQRYGESRHALVRWIVRRLGDATNFKLLIHRPL